MMHDDSFRPSGEPRLLYQVAMPGSGDGSALLSAWVGCCAVPGERSAHTGWVALEGDLDAFSSSLLRDPLFDFAAYAGELVIDLRALRFIDSVGAELLEEVSQFQLARGGFVRLHEPRACVRKVMQLVADAEAATGRSSATSASPCHEAGDRPVTSGAGGRSASAVDDDVRGPQIGARSPTLLTYPNVLRLDEVSFSRF